MVSRALCVLVLLGLLHCTRAPELVVVPELRQRHVGIPVVFVPGVLGSKLRDTRSGEVLWGKGRNLLAPRDGGYATAVPILPGGNGDGAVEAFDVVDEVGLLGFRRVVYKALAEVLESHGYRRGDLGAPRPGDTLFLFAYDWRLDNVLTARRLREGLEKLRAARGEDRLKVHLICQSNGAYACRYFLKYGGAPLDEAEAGRAGPAAGIDVESLILVGTANGGSLRTLRELNRGRRYLGPLGRAWRPETLFTFRSLYQDLPAYEQRYFLDEEGEVLDVDLYDAESWRRFGWSIYGPEASERLGRARRPDLFGSAADRLDFLRRMLGDARRFQRLLARDAAGFGATRYHLVQDGYAPSPRRAVLLADGGGGWRTVFTGDPELKERPHLHALASAPGDGHATAASQLWLSPQERAALAGEPFHYWSSHFGIILEPATQEQILKLLDENAGRGL